MIDTSPERTKMKGGVVYSARQTCVLIEKTFDRLVVLLVVTLSRLLSKSISVICPFHSHQANMQQWVLWSPQAHNPKRLHSITEKAVWSDIFCQKEEQNLMPMVHWSCCWQLFAMEVSDDVASELASFNATVSRDPQLFLCECIFLKTTS